jgi:dihydrofolate reductase
VRIVISEFMSLDGVVQAPGAADEDLDGGFAHGGWSAPYFDAETMGAAFDEAMQSTEAFLFGRRTWQVSASAWPERSGDVFADTINACPKYVASRTLTEADMTWGSTLLPPDDVLGAVAELRRQEGGDVFLYGSPSLVQQLLAHGLVDELRLMIEPIVLGGGKRLFAEDGRSLPLQLVSTRTSATGVHVCVYRPA